MVRIVTWNSNGLSDNKKIDFLRSNFSDLKKVDFTLLVETHLLNEEGIARDLNDFKVTHEVTHSFRGESDTYAGLCFITSHNFSIIEKKEIMTGRILSLKCESKLETGKVGFYGYTSNRPLSLRKEQIITLKEDVSPNCINILMGDFNFVEDALDRNGKLPNVIEKDRYLFSEWKNLKDDYDLIDTFRVLSPLIRRYSFTHPNKKTAQE